MHFDKVAVALALVSTAAGAQDLEVVYCEIPSSPKSSVPGALDEITGLPEATNFRAIEDLFLSPGGTAWMIKGRTQQGSNEENILLLGAGTGGTMFSQEGQPVPGGLPGEIVDFFGSGVGRFNSLDQFGYSLRARGGSSSTFQKVILWDGTSSTITTQMGDLYTGLDDLPPNPVGDETVGNSIGSIHLLDDLRIGAQDSTIGNIHSSKRPAIFYDRAMFHQADTTTVVDLAGTGTILIDGVSSNSFYTSPDGAHWVALVDVDPGIPSDNAVVYDGQVRIQNGQAIPGTGIVSGATFNLRIAPNGDWFARGRDNSGTATSAPDWAVRSGTLIATTGDPLTGGESYGVTFSAFTGNAVGDWALVCNTDSIDPAADEVVVWNGEVVAREGDPVDVDGNGLFDDGAFLGRGNNTLSAFQPDDLALSDGNELYVLATLNDGLGNDLGSSPAFGAPDVMIRIQLEECGAVASYCTAGTSASGCQATLSATGVASATASSGFVVSAATVEGLKSGLFFFGQNGKQAVPWGNGTSFQCVVPPVDRGGLMDGAGTPGLCDGAFSQDLNARWCATCPNPNQVPVAGQALQIQLWYRDPLSTSNQTTSLSDALETDVCP
jgi:hypothetical protein